MRFAEASVTRLAQGDFKSAAWNARQALQAAPDDPTLYALAGVILLNTGDSRGAKTAFENAVACDGRDSLALYGLGLAQLGCGDRSAALDSFQRSERSDGDRTYLLLARRYAQWLGGAQVDVEGAGLPEALRPAQAALQGMAAARQGDRSRVVSELEASVSALPGDAVVQPGGLLMTFDTGQPLASGAPLLPAGGGLSGPLPRSRVLSGDIPILPEDVSPGVAYVSYELDGQMLGLVNVSPFQFNWDSRRSPNGWHTLCVIRYNREGQELGRATRRLRIVNAGAGALGANGERQTLLRAALWQALTLRPDRCACAYALGVAYRAQGELATAGKWFTRAAALEPDYRDARRQLVACSALTEGGDAIWGGVPTEKVVALTFDDGPAPGLTEPLLDILAENQATATFFVIGRHVMEYPDLTRKIVAANMEIANHSYTHRNLTKLSPEEVAQEVMRTQAAVQTVTGRTPRFLRPPGGNWNDEVARIVRRWGLTPCFWLVDVYNSEVISAQQVANAVLGQVRPGSIILMHNGKMSTLQALPTILRELRRRGYAFVTVETLEKRLNAARLAAQNTPRFNASGVPRRAE
jgi:peptidoglycan/xylan/chitin deacetylase (PgdA/CDA1 family)